MNKKVSDGLLHKTPADLKKSIMASDVVYSAWENISVLARNEWICWIESAKKTRDTKRENCSSNPKPKSREEASVLLARMPSSINKDTPSEDGVLWWGGCSTWF
jgi:hypothetical protein